jgi:hypothetical protein
MKSLFIWIIQKLSELKGHLSPKPLWEQVTIIFWLLGPFIMLWERTPADIWLTVCGLMFVFKCFRDKDFCWTKIWWVRSCGIFWLCCIISGFMSEAPIHSASEAFIWFRFPLFAMATVFWLGNSRILFHAMLFTTVAGLFLMCGILLVELFYHGQRGSRLHWPYGDEMPGSYLTRAAMPAYLFLIGSALSVRGKLGWLAGFAALGSIIVSL